MRSLIAALISAGCLAGASDPVTGLYLEDRSSRVYGCPCEWSSEWASNGREAVLAWRIDSGSFQGESLAGLRLAAVLSGRFTLSEAASARRSILLVDSAAPEPRRKAGEEWLRSRYADTLGRVLGVHPVAMELDFEGGGAVLRAGDFLHLRVRRASLDDDTQPWATLLYDPLAPLTGSALTTAVETRFSGAGLGVGWKREDNAITGYIGKFSVR